jgi:hypothetical protein
MPAASHTGTSPTKCHCQTLTSNAAATLQLTSRGLQQQLDLTAAVTTAAALVHTSGQEAAEVAAGHALSLRNSQQQQQLQQQRRMACSVRDMTTRMTA